jgi:hypothetical protein
MHTAIRGLALAALLALVLVPVRGAAQGITVQFDRLRNTVSVDTDGGDVVRVVRSLFSQVGGARYQMDPDVSGTVSVHLRDAKPDEALSAVLGQVGATWRVERGVYYISPRTRRQRPGGNDRDRDDRRFGDRGGRDLDNGDRANVDLADVPAAFRARVGITAYHRPIGEVLGSLNSRYGTRLAADRDVPGDLRVDIVAKDEMLVKVLQRLAIAGRLKLDITGPVSAVLRPRTSVSVDYGTCRNCRYALRREWRYCPMCGERLAGR